jgi:hypothetical protein
MKAGMTMQMAMEQEPAKKEKSVMVTAYPNIAPAGTVISKQGKGSNLSVAICRAVTAVMQDQRVKGKRILLPMKLVVTE